jgi:SNF2 family DNA or RNA helicase
MAQTGRSKTNTRSKRRRPIDEEGIIPILARAVREVENAVNRDGKVNASNRTKFHAAGLLIREEKQRIDEDKKIPQKEREDINKRLDGLAMIMVKALARDQSLGALLDPNAPVSQATQKLKRDMLLASGAELDIDDILIVDDSPAASLEDSSKSVLPQSVRRAELANPFLPPVYAPNPRVTGRLQNWELIEPLFRAFEQGGQAASMDLPEAKSLETPGDLDLMRHQARFVESAKAGHRSYLLADEPGLGKTAQALLAAEATGSFPLLVVVPNVVKRNWEREVERWIPHRAASVIHGDGDDLDAFSDVIIINYDILDRHAGWASRFGFAGMVVDEAHFIKNRESQRSMNVQRIATAIRGRHGNPLMIALTGTPLINEVEDFRMIWKFLGWIDDDKPTTALMASLEGLEMTPADSGFFPEARQCVIDMGIVRRRKADVAKDIPARRVADIPVELDDEIGRSIRDSEMALMKRLLERYDRIIAGRGDRPTGIDEDIVRLIANSEVEESKNSTAQDNVFAMVRRIGQAKATLAADYTVHLANSVGKVVFFAKHIDVMDAAEEHFAKAGFKTTSIRGNQSADARTKAIDDFMNDPDVKVIVCSLTAAGVGINLQVASNVVLAELSWTSAEQTQAIDRVHRIGQELPVTAWRIIAAQTIDSRIADLIDSKAGIAARALDGDDSELEQSMSVQMAALIALLTDALQQRLAA